MIVILEPLNQAPNEDPDHHHVMFRLLFTA